MIRTLLMRDKRGVSVVEFALVIPVFLLLVMGTCDIAYQAYVQAVLTGAVQQAARNGTVQNASTATVDNAVLAQVRATAPQAAFVSGFPTRKNYTQFGDVGPEPFVDLNANGSHDTGECFTDINENGSWDTDPGSSGQGGANDVVVYTVSITYPRLFPLQAMLGWSAQATLNATTMLKNQPYAAQVAKSYPTVCA